MTIMRARGDRLVTGTVGGGIRFQLENVDEFLRDIQIGIDKLPEIMRTILAGDAGEIIRDRAKQKVNRRSGSVSGSIRIHDTRSEGRGVEVGIVDDAQHPGGLSMRKVGEILESGAVPHIIRSKRRGGGLSIGGRVVKRAVHPGVRAQKIMGRTQRDAAGEVELVFVRELWRLAEAMNFDD